MNLWDKIPNDIQEYIIKIKKDIEQKDINNFYEGDIIYCCEDDIDEYDNESFFAIITQKTQKCFRAQPIKYNDLSNYDIYPSYTCFVICEPVINLNKSFLLKLDKRKKE